MFGGQSLSELTPEQLGEYQDEIIELGRRESEAQMNRSRSHVSNTDDSTLRLDNGAILRIDPGAGVHDGQRRNREGAEHMGFGGGGMFGAGSGLGMAQDEFVGLPGGTPGFAPGRLGGPAGGVPEVSPKQRAGFTQEELEKRFGATAKAKAGSPMNADEYRKKQTESLRPPSHAEFVKKHYPHLSPLREAERLAQERLDAELNTRKAKTEENRREVLGELERSQMPAVASQDGRLEKTIEHYSFADAADIATFYIYFDKHLWDGAAKHISESQVKVNSTPTALEIVLVDVPVSDRSHEIVADWRLSLSPLFARVEPTLTTSRIRNGKFTVKLSKAKSVPWKKGVKYS